MKNLVINGKATSTFGNYVRHLAHLALHFNANPVSLSADQVTDYLYLKRTSEDVSKTFFILTVHGLRAACRIYNLPYEQFKLPKLPHKKKLPVVLNAPEAKALIHEVSKLNSRVDSLVIALMLDCGLRISEVPVIKIGHLDIERSRLQVCDSKRGKDRSIPIGNSVKEGLIQHLEYWKPKDGVFQDLNNPGTPISTARISRIIKEAARAAGITKNVSAHTLRHSFATLLIENHTPLPVVQKYMGHSDIKTTMIYLELVSIPDGKELSPVDLVFNRQ